MLPPRSRGVRLEGAHSEATLMRDGAELWAGAWQRVCGKRSKCRSRCASCSSSTAMRRSRARPPISARGPTPSSRRSPPRRLWISLPLNNINIKLGDSEFRFAGGGGGSYRATSVANRIATTAGEIRDDLLRMAKTIPISPRRTPVTRPPSSRSSASNCDALCIGRLHAMVASLVDRIEKEENHHPNQDRFGARELARGYFVEVKVDEQLGVVRTLAPSAAGRIRHQDCGQRDLGGVVWGIGMARTRRASIMRSAPDHGWQYGS